jgi:hypothetical protein
VVVGERHTEECRIFSKNQGLGYGSSLDAFLGDVIDLSSWAKNEGGASGQYLVSVC